MKTKSSILSLLVLLELFVFLGMSASHKNILGDSSVLYIYNNAAEIEKHCSPYLSLASKLSPYESRSYRLKNKLSFHYGDWEQEGGGSPLMPFNESDLPLGRAPYSVPLKLVTFRVKDINSVHHFENYVSVEGTLSIGIARNTSMFSILQSPSFFLNPGLSILTMSFEGVYLETGGERLLCLLGNTSSPISDPVQNYWNLDNSQLLDDQILLVLRYPLTLNLTKRAIRGEMRSLKEPGSLGYFDVVYISSQLNSYSSKYQFSSELKSRACVLHPHQEEELREDGQNTFSGSEFCHFLHEVSQEPFNIFPNYKFNDKHAHQRKLSPFQPEDLRLVWQDLICLEETANDNTNNARVSAVLKAFPASIPEDTARLSTGLSSLTLSSEGSWNSSSGQLCMIGCLGAVDSGPEGCNFQISLYFSRMFSITQRSIILGSISSIRNETEPFFPLLFKSLWRLKFVYPTIALPTFSYLYYNYSKIELATSFRKRNQPAKAFSLLKQLFLKYPALQDGRTQLNPLSNNLNFNAYANCHQSSNSQSLRIYIRMEVLTIGSSFGQFEPQLYENNNQAKTPKGIEKQKLLNVSVHLMFTDSPSVFTTLLYRDLSPLFLEGVYDPLAGDMHLIGCRRASIEPGLDCHLETKVQYTSERGRWLKSPSVEITITSQRSDDDPLHFKPINLQTSMIPYQKYQNDVAFRKLFEAVLRVLISLVVVGVISSQLCYMNKNVDSIPYMSLVMLANQILGYSAELVRASEILFESKESTSYKKWPCNLHEYQLLMKALEFPVRLLVLAALILTLRLYQKVSEAKSKENAYGSNKPKRIPHNKHVIQRNLKIHIGLALILVVLRVRDLFLRNDLQYMGAFIMPGLLMRLVETQVLLYQDFFLLPQIFQNLLWKTQVKPLRKTYYIGLTLMRLVLHFYNYISDPISSPYSEDGDFNQVESDIFSTSGIIAIPIIMIVLPIVVHIQQSWNYLKPSDR